MKTTNSTQRFSIKKAIVSMLALLVSTGAIHAQPITSANLLVDPSFESKVPPLDYGIVTSGFSANLGVWGAESGSAFITGPTDGVGPQHLTQFLRLPGTGAIGSSSQVIQITSLAPYSVEVQAGNASFDVSAWFNFGTGGNPANSRILVRFYNNSTEISSLFDTALTLDGSPIDWQLETFSGVIPTGATFIGTEFLFSESSMNNNFGFVDNAILTVTTVPEPTSLALLGLGGCALLRRRRR